MDEQTSPQVIYSEEALVRFRLDFAQRCFVNIQELNRFMDQKAGLLIAAVGILTAAIGTLATKSLSAAAASELQVWLRLISGGLLAVYLFTGFLAVFSATRVFAALGNILRPETSSPGLIFPLILLSRYKADEDSYFARLSTSAPEDFLRDYSNQIMEISNIYRSKQRLVNLSVARFKWLSILWIAAMLVLGSMLFLP
jgi:hypothetical protein